MKKRLLAYLLCICMLVQFFPLTSALAANFADTDGHWAESAIDRWSEYGVVKGWEGNFYPNNNMTRAESAQVFVNLLGLTKRGDIAAFGDVDSGAWYADALSKAVAAGILNGTDGGKMLPNDPVTREQFFAMFARALHTRPAV